MSGGGACAGLAQVAAVSAGGQHTCILTAAGGVKCWGANAAGQLGDGSATNRSAPVDVAGLTSGVASISAGPLHTCAVTVAGGVKCWGANELGKLGNGSTTNSPVPVDVTGLGSGVVSVSAGGVHTCAIVTGGAVKCWGGNIDGELGDSSNANRIAPVAVTGLTSGISMVAAGAKHTCALTSGGGVKCWGKGASGQVGDGTGLARTSPVDVSGLTSGVASIATTYYHSCAVTTAGGAKCWGDNHWSQLGDGSSALEQLAPVDVLGSTSNVAAVSTSYQFSCALGSGGGVRCWPNAVTGMTSGIAMLSTGAYHSCVLAGSGAVLCWGENGAGQLGDGTKIFRAAPVTVWAP